MVALSAVLFMAFLFAAVGLVSAARLTRSLAELCSRADTALDEKNQQIRKLAAETGTKQTNTNSIFDIRSAHVGQLAAAAADGFFHSAIEPPLSDFRVRRPRSVVENPPSSQIITSPDAFDVPDLYVDLQPHFGQSLFLKCEGFNFAGSAKLKTASAMIESAERDGRLLPDSILVESSSGNLGVALSMIAASRGLKFLCVTDVHCNLSSKRTMEALGGEVRMVREEPNPISGYLGARLQYVRDLCASDQRYVWLNQYTNPENAGAHYRRTAPAIARAFPALDVLFIGVGTCGTLMGCAQFFREWNRPVRIVAVDSVGSIAFGHARGRRMIPGLGTSVRPAMLDEGLVDDVVRVEEIDAIETCHRLAGNGFLFGGSTGTVVSGAMSWLETYDTHPLTAVAIAPDLGERYLDTVYQSNWVQSLYGTQFTGSEEHDL